MTATNFRSSLSETWLAEQALAELPDALTDAKLDPAGDLLFRRARLLDPHGARASDRPGRFCTGSPTRPARLNINRFVSWTASSRGPAWRNERDVIVDSIQDWRDPNEEHRLNGAESDYYLGLPVPYRSKNADFDSCRRVLQVKGVTARSSTAAPMPRVWPST